MSIIAPLLTWCVSKRSAHAHPGSTSAFRRASQRSSINHLCRPWRWCFVTWEPAWQNPVGAPLLLLLGPVPLLYCPLPVLHRTSDQRAGPCFGVESRVTFRPTLGQRSSLELCRCICRGSGEELWVPSASFTGRGCPEAVTGFTVPQSQHLPGGLASTWGVGDVKPLVPSMNAKRCAASLLLK